MGGGKGERGRERVEKDEGEKRCAAKGGRRRYENLSP